MYVTVPWVFFLSSLFQLYIHLPSGQNKIVCGKLQKNHSLRHEFPFGFKIKNKESTFPRIITVIDNAVNSINDEKTIGRALGKFLKNLITIRETQRPIRFLSCSSLYFTFSLTFTSSSTHHGRPLLYCSTVALLTNDMHKPLP